MSPTTDLPAAHRPGLRAWRSLVVNEARMVARDRAGLVVPILLPLVILVMSTAERGSEAYAPGYTVLDAVVLPLVLAIVLASIGVINLPSFLAYYRRSGILRRLGVTPLPPLTVLGAQVAVGVVQALAGIGLTLGVAVVGYGASPPARPLALAVVVLLAAVALFATGMVVASFAPTPSSAVALGMVLFFVLGALGGMFGGTDALPEPLVTVGEWLPFGAATELMSAAWVGADLPPEPLLALVGAGVVGSATAARFFRWDR